MGKLKEVKALDNSNNGFSETVKFQVMHQAGVEANHNKFYCIELQKNPAGQFRVFTHYGRLGKTNTYGVRNVDENGKPLELSVADAEYERIIKEKTKGKKIKDDDGQERIEKYECVDVVMPSVGSENIQKKAVKTVSVKAAHIDSSVYSDPHVSRIIDQIVDENIHNITTNTTLTLTSSGFETPLGPVTKDHVQKARQPLTLMNGMLDAKGNLDSESKQVREANNLYFSLIPHPFGHKIKQEDWILKAEHLEKEFDLLDQLETAVQMGTSLNQSSAQRLNALGTDVELVKDKKQIGRIDNYIEKSKAGNHRGSDVWNYHLKNVFAIKIPSERERYEKQGKLFGNIKELFHGSKNCNILSILKSGLIVPPTNAGFVTGRMFGNGLYFAHNSTKSLNYSIGFWGGGRNKHRNAFLFLADVAMGKEHEVYHQTQRPASGYDSIHAVKGQGLYNDEFIVYKLSQATLTYLIEMEK